MDFKDYYEHELIYLSELLDDAKHQLSAQGLTTNTKHGNDRREEVNPKIEAYQKIEDMYLKTLKEYQALFKE